MRFSGTEPLGVFASSALETQAPSLHCGRGARALPGPGHKISPSPSGKVSTLLQLPREYTYVDTPYIPGVIINPPSLHVSTNGSLLNSYDVTGNISACVCAGVKGGGQKKIPLMPPLAALKKATQETDSQSKMAVRQQLVTLKAQQSPVKGTTYPPSKPGETHDSFVSLTFSLCIKVLVIAYQTIMLFHIITLISIRHNIG